MSHYPIGHAVGHKIFLSDDSSGVDQARIDWAAEDIEAVGQDSSSTKRIEVVVASSTWKWSENEQGQGLKMNLKNSLKIYIK